MRDDPPATNLVARARTGEKQAWDTLVERYAPLVWSICRQHQLGRADADDVGQIVWLHMVDQLDKIRDPAALSAWLATTTRRECGRVRRAARAPQASGQVLDADNIADSQATTAEHGLFEAFTHLPPRCQRLLALLIEDPPVPYAQISARLGIPVGSIGPSRSRCLDNLRRHPAIAALINPETPIMEEEPCGQAVVLR